MTPQYGHRPTILQTPNPDITIPRRRGEEGIVRTHVDIRHDARVTPQGTNQNRPAHIRAVIERRVGPIAAAAARLLTDAQAKYLRDLVVGPGDEVFPGPVEFQAVYGVDQVAADGGGMGQSRLQHRQTRPIGRR